MTHRTNTPAFTCGVKSCKEADRKGQLGEPRTQLLLFGTCGDIICMAHYRVWQKRKLSPIDQQEVHQCPICRQSGVRFRLSTDDTELMSMHRNKTLPILLLGYGMNAKEALNHVKQALRFWEYHHKHSTDQTGPSARDSRPHRQAIDDDRQSAALLESLRALEQKKADIKCKIAEYKRESSRLNAQLLQSEEIEKASKRDRKQTKRKLSDEEKLHYTKGRDKRFSEEIEEANFDHDTPTSAKSLLSLAKDLVPNRRAGSAVSHCSSKIDDEILRMLGTGERGDLLSLMKNSHLHPNRDGNKHSKDQRRYEYATSDLCSSISTGRTVGGIGSLASSATFRHRL